MSGTATKAPRKMAVLDMRGIAGVERAANGSQMTADGERVSGWQVMKSDGTPVEGEMATAEEVKAATERAEKAEKDLADQTAFLEAEAKKQADEAAAAEATTKAAGDKDLDPIELALKSADTPEPVRKALEAQAEAIKKADERAERAEKAAEVERDQRVAAEFVGKAEELVTHLPTDSATFGPVLRAASESLTAEQFTALETVLRGANEQLEASAMFSELGGNGPAVAATGADAKIAAKAEEIRKADMSLTPEQAMDRAYVENPGLVAERRAEMTKG